MALNNFKNTLKKLTSLEGICDSFGKGENAALFITTTVAAFKGIFRPTFTLMDKKQDPESKKYAAFRELLTEVIAIPTYIAFDKATKWLTTSFYKGKVPEDQLKNIKVTSGFIGVCIAALAIPAVCNVVQPPVMRAFKKYQDSKKAKEGLDINSDDNLTTINQNNTLIQKPGMSNPVVAANKPSAMDMYLMTRNSSGMRVGN